MTAREIEDKLISIIFYGKGIPEYQLDNMIDLARAGESGVALENFCTQLFEYDISIPTRIKEEIILLGASMGIAPRYWMELTTN